MTSKCRMGRHWLQSRTPCSLYRLPALMVSTPSSYLPSAACSKWQEGSILQRSWGNACAGSSTPSAAYHSTLWRHVSGGKGIPPHSPLWPCRMVPWLFHELLWPMWWGCLMRGTGRWRTTSTPSINLISWPSIGLGITCQDSHHYTADSMIFSGSPYIICT